MRRGRKERAVEGGTLKAFRQRVCKEKQILSIFLFRKLPDFLQHGIDVRMVSNSQIPRRDLEWGVCPGVCNINHQTHQPYWGWTIRRRSSTQHCPYSVPSTQPILFARVWGYFFSSMAVSWSAGAHQGRKPGGEQQNYSGRQGRQQKSEHQLTGTALMEKKKKSLLQA